MSMTFDLEFVLSTPDRFDIELINSRTHNRKAKANPISTIENMNNKDETDDIHNRDPNQDDQGHVGDPEASGYNVNPPEPAEVLTQGANDDFQQEGRRSPEEINTSTVDTGSPVVTTVRSESETTLDELLKVHRSPEPIKTSTMTCWNCGQEGHSTDKCTQALNLEKVDRARAAFKALESPSLDAKVFHFDDSSPVAPTTRRSFDPILDLTRAARRVSNAAFQSPLPMEYGPRMQGAHGLGHTFNDELEDVAQAVPPTAGRYTATPGGGGGPPSSSSSSDSSHRNPDRGNAGPGPPPGPPSSSSSSNPRTVTPPPTSNNVIRIQGRELQIRSRPINFSTDHLNRIWNKYERHLLPTEDRLAFDTKAGGYVLNKNNKLRLLSSTIDDDEALQKNCNLQHQLRALRQHCDEFDISDVFTILIPYDVRQSPRLRTEKYNLFDDYMILDPDLVGQSNVYYNRYCADKFIGENLALTYNMLKLNTDETLFFKCLEEYDRYHPFQQGGPLMLSLILKKINSATEQQLDYLKTKAKKLRISSLEGENVDKAISLLDAALHTFNSASTPTLSRKPVEWEKDLISIFQTSTVPTFNRLFLKIQNDVRQTADMSGGQPEWPSHEKIIRLASATYNRLKLSGAWDTPSAAKKKAFTMQPVPAPAQAPFRPSNPNKPFRPPNSNQRPPMTCWNCGQEGHGINKCTQALNQEKIDRAREAFNASKRKRTHFRANMAIPMAIPPTKEPVPVPRANVAAEALHPRGYTNRNLEATLRDL